MTGFYLLVVKSKVAIVDLWLRPDTLSFDSYHKHLKSSSLIKIRPELLNLFLVADANDNALMEEKNYHYAKITFNVIQIVQT